MGHHNANLDPLGISCVNFDEAPVATGYQHVGEKCFLSFPQLCRTSLMSLFCYCRSPSHPALPYPISLTLSLLLSFFPFLLSFLSTSYHFIFTHTSIFMLSHSVPRFFFFFFSHDGCICISCRSGVTMLLSWTPWGSWMLIWTHAFLQTLLRLRINSVRS